MLNLIYGIPGSDKSTRLYSLALKNLSECGKSVLVVPEQEAVSAERRIYEAAKEQSLLGLDVMNFDKLCETVFRKCGSLSLKYVTDSTKKLLLSKTLSDIAPALNEYSGRHDDEAFVSGMLAQLTEFKYARITPTALAAASKRIARDASCESDRLLKRIDELSLIFASFNTLVNDVSADPCDRLTKAAELIRAQNPFGGARVYFDSFNGFTAQEYEIIEALLSVGVDVTVTLCNPGSDKVGEVFFFTEDTEARLIKCASAASVDVSKTVVNDTSQYESAAIKHIAENFTLAGKTAVSDACGDVSIISCADLFDECETCAALISKAVRSGLRYRDITVVVRDTDKYRGMIDAALERYSVPCFFSVKTDITEKSLIRFILSALTICKNTPKYTDIIDYLRCGLTELSDFEIDMLESYASSWKISGKIWYSENGFTMNPRGYMPLTSEDSEALSEINALREKVMTPLEGLRAEIKACKTVNDYSRAIYAFLSAVPVREKLAARAETMDTRGEHILADEEAGLLKALCDALDELALALGSNKCTLDEYIKLFRMILADTDIGTIPQSSDVVTVGDATLLRAGGVKHTFMLGCEEGSFPKSTSIPGLLSLEDRKILAEHELDEISFDPVIEASKELFHFYCAACSPTHKLTLSYSRRAITGEEIFPSSALIRIDSMFGGITVNSNELDACDKISGKDSFIEHIPYFKALIPEDRLTAFIESDNTLKEKYDAANVPLSPVDEHLSKQAVNTVFPGDLGISQTATDTYAKCPFSFQCKYALKLHEKNSATIEKSDLGTLVHSVLNDFLEDGIGDVIKGGAVDRDEIYKRVRDITDKHSKLLIEFTSEEKRARVSRMLGRIADITAMSAANLAEEFNQSGFVPTFCEFPISSRTGGGLMPLKLSLEDGSYVVLGGIADRVDTMVKGGKLYIRVADYKTGNRAFSLENIRAGLSLQLLIYLFSIWENADDTFRHTAHAEDGCEIIPAGAEYVMTMPESVEGTADADKLSESLSKAFKRSGIYLADSEIINAMDTGFSGKFVPVKQTMKANGKSVLATLDEFNALKDEVSGILTDIGNGIKRGNAQIKPLAKSSDRPYDACEFCPMKPVCKNVGIEADEE